MQGIRLATRSFFGNDNGIVHLIMRLRMKWNFMLQAEE